MLSSTRWQSTCSRSRGCSTARGSQSCTAARQDLEVLDRACATIPSRLVDTQLLAGFLGYTSPSLSTLLDRELQVSAPKADRLTDWLRRPLGAAQLTYAAADVANLLALARLAVGTGHRAGPCVLGRGGLRGTANRGPRSA
ncbi:MAG: hypothetical protein V9E94_11240 [Microthrixaceae bacterium]